MTNRGYIHEPPPIESLTFGAYKDLPVIRKDGDWTDVLPVFEKQFINFETYGCVSFSGLNCLEALYKAKFKTETNWSDRFTVVMSETGRRGNSIWRVAESIETDGLVPEDEWPYNVKTRDEYFSEIPLHLKIEGQQLLESWSISHQYISANPEAMFEALKKAPLQVAFHAYGEVKNDIFQRSTKISNHVVMCYGAEHGKYWKLYDHYEGRPYKKLAWNSLFWGVNLFTLDKKDKTMQFKDDTMYFNVDEGGYYFFAKGKLMKVENWEQNNQWLWRNRGDVANKMGELTSADLEGVEIYNFKGEKI